MRDRGQLLALEEPKESENHAPASLKNKCNVNARLAKVL